MEAFVAVRAPVLVMQSVQLHPLKYSSKEGSQLSFTVRAPTMMAQGMEKLHGAHQSTL